MTGYDSGRGSINPGVDAPARPVRPEAIPVGLP